MIFFIIIISLGFFPAWCFQYRRRCSLRQAGLKGYPWQQGTFPAHSQLCLISLGSVFLILRRKKEKQIQPHCQQTSRENLWLLLKKTQTGHAGWLSSDWWLRNASDTCKGLNKLWANLYNAACCIKCSQHPSTCLCLGSVCHCTVEAAGFVSILPCKKNKEYKGVGILQGWVLLYKGTACCLRVLMGIILVCNSSRCLNAGVRFFYNEIG